MATPDNSILQRIVEGGKSLEQAMQELYTDEQCRGQALSLLLRMGGRGQDFEDIFQDSIAHLIMNIRKGKFKGESSMKTYLLSICKHLWLNKSRQQANRETLLTKQPLVSETGANSPEDILLYQERTQTLQLLLGKIGDPCRRILSLWSLSYSMDEISQLTSYKNAAVVRKKKHHCMQQLMKMVRGEDDQRS
jgi:RNA polymerase sigma factor (sigma-70 family)